MNVSDSPEQNLCRMSKEEIAKKPLFSHKDKLAFMSALIFTSGSLIIHGENVAVTVVTQNEPLTKLVSELTENLTGRACAISSKGKTHEIVIDNALNLLLMCGVLVSHDDGIAFSDGIAKEFCEEQSAAAYVRGAYLGSGSLTAGKYHLEFSFGKKTLAEDFSRLLGGYGISAKFAARKHRAVVYVKDSQSISDCLALMGAAKAVLALNSLIAQRQMSEHINRQKNCDIHNIDKQIDAGLRQCDLIKELDLQSLTPPLRETAKARLSNPDMSYEQLGALLGISKSGVKNRLRRLTEIYEKNANKTPYGGDKEV